MRVLGLEISDAGVMVAEPPSGHLLKVDGESLESPGIALSEKEKLLIGEGAEAKMHESPRFACDTFWDLLDTKPLSQPGYKGLTHADLAYGHLKEIWRAVKAYGDELIVAVPSFFMEEQIGLILGMSAELSMPVRGFVTLALASASKPADEDLVFHLDITLHRAVITLLQPGERLSQRETVSLQSKGMVALVSEWKKSIAKEFVQKTRFDPLYTAASEQELHGRLPGLLALLLRNESARFEMKSGLHRHALTLGKDLFLEKSRLVFSAMAEAVESLRKKTASPDATAALLVTHRIARIPGWQESLGSLPGARLFALEQGAAAKGALHLLDLFEAQRGEKGVVLVTSRPWGRVYRGIGEAAGTSQGRGFLPTHVLHRDMAYPISGSPLVITSDRGKTRIHVRGDDPDPSPAHCTVRIEGKQVIVTNHSPSGTFLDGVKVSGSAPLTVGQTIQTAESDEAFRLIACVEKHET
jgi:hypothetical protein